jgi:hypothetical protein
MKKQFVKAAVTVACATIFSAASTCIAQPRVLSATVTFTFEVGNTRLPAGRYEIKTVATGAGNLLSIRQVNGTSMVRFHTIAVESRSRDARAELVFHRYGNDYFLSEIRNGDGSARELAESKQEKEDARLGAPAEIAIAVR